MNEPRLHPEALADVREIWHHIAEDSPDNADRVNEKIEAAIARLSEFPHQGFKRPELTDRPLRFVLAHDYLIAYSPETVPLFILAVLHGRREPRILAALLRERH